MPAALNQDLRSATGVPCIGNLINHLLGQLYRLMLNTHRACFVLRDERYVICHTLGSEGTLHIY